MEEDSPFANYLSILLNCASMRAPSIREIDHRSKTNRKGYEWVLDYVANYVVKLILPLRLTPTDLTLFWVIVQFLAPLFFLLAEYRYFVIGIILFQFMFIIDLSDGKLYRFLQSYKKGPNHKILVFHTYLDRMGHFLNNCFLFICLGIGTWLRFDNFLYVYIGFIAGFFYTFSKAITINPGWYRDQDRREATTVLLQRATPRYGKSNLKQLVFDVLRIEHLGGVLFFGIILDQPRFVLLLYAVIYIIEFVRKLFRQGMLLVREDRKRRREFI